MCEAPSVYSTSYPKARREHRCCECDGTIFKGERYHIFNGCWDGEWDSFKSCDDCQAIRKEIYHTERKKHRDYEGIAFGDLCQEVFEGLAPLPAMNAKERTMKRYKQVHVPATVREKLDVTVCDLCGDESDCEWSPGSPFQSNEVDVSYREATHYPDGGFAETTSFDICPTCFTEKLVPWLKSQGAEPTITETDY